MKPEPQNTKKTWKSNISFSRAIHNQFFIKINSLLFWINHCSHELFKFVFFAPFCKLYPFGLVLVYFQFMYITKSPQAIFALLVHWLTMNTSKICIQLPKTIIVYSPMALTSPHHVLLLRHIMLGGEQSAILASLFLKHGRQHVQQLQHQHQLQHWFHILLWLNTNPPDNEMIKKE